MTAVLIAGLALAGLPVRTFSTCPRPADPSRAPRGPNRRRAFARQGHRRRDRDLKAKPLGESLHAQLVGPTSAEQWNLLSLASTICE